MMKITYILPYIIYVAIKYIKILREKDFMCESNFLEYGHIISWRNRMFI